ncbi:hypothetical protein [Halosimplex salinum]|uniref:hypothetical protein n=1 Tax=Halosimplex salinum TaxID=1710538 RepID=UPI000F485C03|nr:hypothetical protein [Halosimplex salinum]
MSAALQTHPLNATAVAFVAGLLAVTLFGVVVTGDPVDRAALGGIGYAAGGAIGVYIACAGAGSEW